MNDARLGFGVVAKWVANKIALVGNQETVDHSGPDAETSRELDQLHDCWCSDSLLRQATNSHVIYCL